MIKETKSEQTITTRQKFCDECGVEIKFGMACSAAKCEMCHIDLCDKCIGHEVSVSGDYREVYCKYCWNIGESNRKEILEHETAIDVLNEDWLKKCKNKSKK